MDPGMFCLAWDYGGFGDESSLAWVVRVDGHIVTAQPGPFGRWWDAHLVDVAPAAPPRSVTFVKKPQVHTPPLVQTVIGTYEDGRLLAAVQQRADPLFRDTEFCKRWPIPDLDKPLMVLTASKDSAGWRDLGRLHGLAKLEHHHALRLDEVGTARRLIFFMREAVKESDAWGGVLITRGGGNQPGEQRPADRGKCPSTGPMSSKR
jgi:hypothetical protein